MTQSNDTPRPVPLVALLRAEERAWLDATPPAGHPLIHGIFQRLPERLRAALDSIEEVSREPLTGLPEATCYRTHTQPDENRGVYGAVWLADVKRALAATPPSREGAGLDVSREDAAKEQPEWIDLAADIRAVDGNHDLGAGSLAAELTARGWTRLAAAPMDVAMVVRETLDIARAHPLWPGTEVIAKVLARLASEEQRETP